MTGEVFCTSR